ncbi:hypothetical protein BDY19DRAFT_878351, partial [Irpex rosettiformis]
AEWLLQTSQCFVKALCKEKLEGRMVENGFKPITWTNAAAALQSELGLSFSTKQLKNQWTSVCIPLCFLLHMLTFSLSGFGWDEERSMVTATDSVWTAFLAKHDKYAWFRTHPFPLFNDLATLCENTFALGEHAFAME